jgi:protein TonB
MFETTLIAPTRKRRPICLGYAVEGALLAALVLVPLIHVQALPEPLIYSVIVPPAPAGAVAKPSAARVTRQPNPSRFMSAPVSIPTMVLPQRREPEASSDPPIPAPVGVVPWANGNDLPDGLGTRSLPLPPEPPAAPSRASRITVGGVVESARLIYEVRPDYPVLAIGAHMQGTVRLEAVIDQGGSVQSLHVLSGPPLLVPSALHAVAQWRYQPTLLDGAPVEVATEIDVNFTLNE